MPSHLTTVAPKHKRPLELLLVMSLPFLKDPEFNLAGFQPSTDRHKNPHHFSQFASKLPFLEVYFDLFVLCPLSSLRMSSPFLQICSLQIS